MSNWNIFAARIPIINIKVIFTGKKTMTGGRIRRLKKYLFKERFLLTYGDGLCDVNLFDLVNFHKKSQVILWVRNRT